jgi:hypothetical protein
LKKYVQGPIPKSQLQRHRYNKLERSFEEEEEIFFQIALGYPWCCNSGTLEIILPTNSQFATTA